MDKSTDIDYSACIPIFPLADVVLLPRAILPLHIFEQRYSAMTRDALDGSRVVAIALLRPGFEPLYDTLDADIHDVVCVGRILHVEEQPDDHYNFWLQGLQRARITEENKELPYRRALVRPLSEGLPDATTEGDLRLRLGEILSRRRCRAWSRSCTG